MTEQIAYCVRPLDASTWDAFAEVVERNNGVFGGCWCMGFHPERFQMYRAGYAGNRATKEAKVREGRAHAALVFGNDGIAQGWCQYGSPEELPAIKHRREYEKNEPPRHQPAAQRMPKSRNTATALPAPDRPGAPPRPGNAPRFR